MRKNAVWTLIVILLFASMAFANFDRFRVDFPQCSLVYVPASNILQIGASGRVLSTGTDWTVQQVYSYLFHLRLNSWSGFYWMVNTSRREVHRVTNGTFGSIGGTQTKLNIAVETVGGTGGSPPTRFTLQFNDANLIYVRSTRVVQIAAQGNVLSTGHDWQKAEVYSYLIHIRHQSWSDFYWKVNTSRKEIYEQRGGTFGSVSGGTQTLLNFPVTVFGQTQTYALSVVSSPPTGGTVTGSGTFAGGSTASVQATPNPGFQFVRWMRGATVVSNQPSFSYSMPNENVTLTAYFTPMGILSYTLSLTTNPPDAGMVTGGGQFSPGFAANLQAVANPGYQFVHWRRGAIIVSNQASFAYTMPSENVALTAHFTPLVQPVGYTLDLQMNPPMGGMVTGAGQYAAGAWVNIQAVANAGYQFTGWTQSDPWSGWPGVPFSNQANHGFSMPAQNLTLVANFTQVQSIPSQPSLGVYVENHPQGVVVTNVASGYPAHGRIQLGDVLTHVGFYPSGSLISYGDGRVNIGGSIVRTNAPMGIPIQSPAHMQTIMGSMPAGQAVAIWLIRGGVYRLFVVLNLGTPFASSYLF